MAHPPWVPPVTPLWSTLNALLSLEWLVLFGISHNMKHNGCFSTLNALVRSYCFLNGSSSLGFLWWSTMIALVPWMLLFAVNHLMSYCSLNGSSSFGFLLWDFSARPSSCSKCWLILTLKTSKANIQLHFIQQSWHSVQQKTNFVCFQKSNTEERKVAFGHLLIPRLQLLVCCILQKLLYAVSQEIMLVRPEFESFRRSRTSRNLIKQRDQQFTPTNRHVEGTLWRLGVHGYFLQILRISKLPEFLQQLRPN